MSQLDNTAKKVIKQVNFYFSDGNLINDKFMKTSIKEGTDRYVSLEKMMSFKRMKQISSDKEVVTAALAHSEIVELNEEKTLVRRKEAFNFDLESADLKPRTVYAKGFPVDSTLEKLEEYFTQHGNVEVVRMRHYAAGGVAPFIGFKGAVLVQFKSVEEAEKVAAMELEYEGKKLDEVSMMNVWSEKKEALKKQKYADKVKSGEIAPAKPARAAIEKIPGVVVHITELGAGIEREDIQEAFGGREKLAYTEFYRGETHAFVRFKTADDCTNMVEEMKEKKKMFGGKEPIYAFLKGEEEEAYWAKVIKASSSKGSFRSNKGRRGGYQGRKKFGKRSRDNDRGDSRDAKRSRD